MELCLNSSHCTVCLGQDKITITCDKHTFNWLRKEGFTFLVVADEAFGRQIPFAYLDRVSEDFLNSHATKAKSFTPGSLNRSFSPKLKQHMVSSSCGQLRASHASSTLYLVLAPTHQHEPVSCVYASQLLSETLVCLLLLLACLQDYCTNNPDEISRIAACQKKVDDVKCIMVCSSWVESNENETCVTQDETAQVATHRPGWPLPRQPSSLLFPKGIPGAGHSFGHHMHARTQQQHQQPHTACNISAQRLDNRQISTNQAGCCARHNSDYFSPRQQTKHYDVHASGPESLADAKPNPTLWQLAF